MDNRLHAMIMNVAGKKSTYKECITYRDICEGKVPYSLEMTQSRFWRERYAEAAIRARINRLDFTGRSGLG